MQELFLFVICICAAFRGFFEYAYPKLAELVRMYSR